MSESPVRFLVIGAGRGGTSLLAGLLDFHSCLEVGFELFSMATIGGKEMPPGADTKIFDDRLTAFLRHCGDEALRYPGKIWGNKITTEHIGCLEEHNEANPGEEIEVLDRLFNDALRSQKIVFILRDGRGCVRSKVNRTGQSMRGACRRWRYSARCYQFLRDRHQNNIRVRFEDLLRSPEPTLRSVCDFLEIPFEPSMLNGTSNQKMLPEYQQGGIDPARAAVAELPAEYLDLIRDDLVDCGYTVD